MDRCMIEVIKTPEGYTYTFQDVGLKISGHAKTREQVAQIVSRWISKHFN